MFQACTSQPRVGASIEDLGEEPAATLEELDQPLYGLPMPCALYSACRVPSKQATLVEPKWLRTWLDDDEMRWWWWWWWWNGGGPWARGPIGLKPTVMHCFYKSVSRTDWRTAVWHQCRCLTRRRSVNTDNDDDNETRKTIATQRDQTKRGACDKFCQRTSKGY